MTIDKQTPEEEDTQRALYLEYVRGIERRNLDRQKIMGASSWALLGALTFIFWQSIPLVTLIKSEPHGYRDLLPLTAHLILVFQCFAALYASMQTRSQIRPQDYRVFRGESIVSAWPTVALLAIVLGVPGTTSFLAVEAVPDGHIFQLFVLRLNYGLCLLLIVSAAIAWLSSLRASKHRDLPPPLLKSSIAGAIAIGIALALLTTNALNIIPAVEIIGGEHSEAIFHLSANLAIAFIAAQLLFLAAPRAQTLHTLEALERDIVMRRLPSSEIRARIEEDYLGREFGDAIRDRVLELREKATALQEWIATFDDRLDAIRKIDAAQYPLERQGRVEELTEELRKHKLAIHDEWIPFRRWGQKVIGQPFTDRHVITLAKQIFDEIGQAIDVTLDEAIECADKIIEISKDRALQNDPTSTEEPLSPLLPNGNTRKE